MKLQRFFVHKLLNEPIGDRREVHLQDEGLVHQLKRVFRLHVGSSVMLLDNTGWQYTVEIVSLEKSEGVFRVLEKHEPQKGRGGATAGGAGGDVHCTLPVTLFQSLPKKDKFEYVLEKGTEIGVSGFVPVLSDRSEKLAINKERCEKILVEASEQSERATVPTLAPICPIDELFDKYGADTEFVAFHLTGTQWSAELRGELVAAAAAKAGGHGCLGILVGPEGGWTDRELGLFREKGVQIVTVGSQVLRTETAAIVAAALVMVG